MDVSFLVFIMTLHSPYSSFSFFTSSSLLTAQSLPSLPVPLHTPFCCFYKASPDFHRPHWSPPSCVFHSTYCPLHEITWYIAKSTGLGVWEPKFKLWLHHLIAVTLGKSLLLLTLSVPSYEQMMVGSLGRLMRWGPQGAHRVSRWCPVMALA